MSFRKIARSLGLIDSPHPSFSLMIALVLGMLIASYALSGVSISNIISIMR